MTNGSFVHSQTIQQDSRCQMQADSDMQSAGSRCCCSMLCTPCFMIPDCCVVFPHPLLVDLNVCQSIGIKVCLTLIWSAIQLVRKTCRLGISSIDRQHLELLYT